MAFKLGAKSKKELTGVHPDLVRVVQRAIQITSVDFTVNDGIRTKAEQAHYVKIGASKTMKSKHLEGRAVDLVAVDDRGRMLWEWGTKAKPGPVVMVAFAMIRAAEELGLDHKITWGAIWDKKISQLKILLPKDAYTEIDAYKVRHKGSDFLDGPHFQLDA